LIEKMKMVGGGEKKGSVKRGIKTGGWHNLRTRSIRERRIEQV